MTAGVVRKFSQDWDSGVMGYKLSSMNQWDKMPAYKRDFWLCLIPVKSSQDEQISPQDYVNTKKQITRHRGETHPGMKLVPW